MSKAFTRESDDSPEEDLAPSRSQLPLGTKNYITPAGALKLRASLAALLEEKRGMTTITASHDVAKDTDVRKLEARIRQFQITLDSVVVCEPPGVADRERVCFGAEVSVRHGNAEQAVYRIVGVDETDLEHNIISWLSPLARALLSRRVGDVVRFHAPAGEDLLTILAISFPALELT